MPITSTARFFNSQITSGSSNEGLATLGLITCASSLVYSGVYAFYGLVGACVSSLFGGATPILLSMAAGAIGGAILGLPLFFIGTALAGNDAKPSLPSFFLDVMIALVVGGIGALFLGTGGLAVAAGAGVCGVLEGIFNK